VEIPKPTEDDKAVFHALVRTGPTWWHRADGGLGDPVAGVLGRSSAEDREEGQGNRVTLGRDAQRATMPSGPPVASMVGSPDVTPTGVRLPSLCAANASTSPASPLSTNT